MGDGGRGVRWALSIFIFLIDEVWIYEVFDGYSVYVFRWSFDL